MYSIRVVALFGAGLLSAGSDASRLTRALSARQSNSTSGSNSTSSGSTLPNYFNPPNATGSYAINGFDLSKPYDAASSNETGWFLNITVATNREIENVTDADTRGNPTYLSLTSPKNAFESAEFDSGWSICGNFWSINDLDLQASFLDDNGTCTSVLSAECIADLEEKAVNFTNDGGCPNDIEIDKKKCPDFGISNSVSRFSGDTPVTADLADSLNNDTSASGSAMLYSPLFPYSHVDNATETDDVYNLVTQKTWPSVLTFYYDDGNGVKAFSTVRCLRARDLAAGSKTPVPLEGAATLPGVSAALAMGASLAAVFVIWM